MLEIAIAVRSEVGQRERNEDDLRHGGREGYWYAVLSDGAGGHRNGAVASDLAVRTAARSLEQAGAPSSQALHNAISDANYAINSQQQGLRDHQRMHATVVALWIDLPRMEAFWAHAGDSRLYLVRQARVERLTRDDSVVQQMIDAGLISHEEGRHHPCKNQLLSALGADERIDTHATREPFALRDGDAFLLCSDGWWDVVTEADVERCLRDAASVEDWLDQMAQLVVEHDAASQDNFSAIGVWIGDPTETTRIGEL